MLKGNLEIVRFESASKVRDRWCSSNVILQVVHVADAEQRNARDPIFVWDEHDSSCLSSAEDLSSRRQILLVIRDLRYVGSPNSRSPVNWTDTAAGAVENKQHQHLAFEWKRFKRPVVELCQDSKSQP